MHTVFYTLQDFLLHSKGVTYVLMGVALVSMLGYWLFITDRDKKPRLY